MESEEDKASHQHPKWKKPTNSAGFPSNSMQDLNFTIPLLPSELITEILSRLPVKSLLKFRCVSKSWLALISSPEFIQTHLSSYTQHRVMWNSIQGVNIKDCNLDSLFNDSVTEVSHLGHRMISDGLYNELPNYITILSSVNGLICLVDSKYNLFLWNPSNRKYKKLPCPRATLWFDKALMYGFGYDEFHDDYKLLGTFCRKGILVKGKLHWPNAKVNGLISDYKEWNIISFDLANEKWGEVEHPCYKEGYIHLYLGVLGSDLSIFCDNAASHVDFWVMKEYGVKQSWTKMFTVNYPLDTPRCDFYLPCFMSNKGEIFFRFVKYSMIYKLKDSSFRYSEVIDFDEFPKIAIYVESLVCPFSKEKAADATKRKRLKKLQSRKPSDKELNEYIRYSSEFGPTEPTQEEAIQIQTEKVAGGRRKGRTYGLGSRNKLRRLEEGWASIGSSR